MAVYVFFFVSATRGGATRGFVVLRAVFVSDVRCSGAMRDVVEQREVCWVDARCSGATRGDVE